ncbi:MAG: 50S ribosomal protein L30 [Myxococcales bacterium]|nr:50S ribosomal protein L30 [Myxococcales bacterium]
MAEGKVKVTLKRSVIGALKKQKQTVEALGLRKRHHSVVHQDTPQIRGMIEKVAHLVEIEEL